MSIKNIRTREEKPNEEKIKDILQEKNNNFIIRDTMDDSIDYPKEKINKPAELKNFDAVTHFKQNLIHFDKNCPDMITDSSYYCFTCKHSVCDDCGLLGHKEHLLIQRDNCLNYDSSFFNEISKVIEKGICLENKKIQIKKDISKSINELKDQLDLIEKEKLKEIDNIFREIKSNYVELKENYLKTKNCIDQYYRTNKKFFNIKVKHAKRNSSNNLSEKKNKENNQENKNNISIRNNTFNYLNINEGDSGPNRDIENTVFLMNFEMMNLCDNKNLQILEISNNINKKIKEMSVLIEDNTKSFTEKLKNEYLCFDSEIIAKFDDFYWDIKVRCEKYTEQILQFQNTIHDMYKRNGNLDKLKDILSLFDSKNNKGKDVLFNQQFFLKMNDLSSLRTDVVKNMAKKLFLSNGKIRKTSKNKYASKFRFSPLANLSRKENKDESKKAYKSLTKQNSNNNLLNKVNTSNVEKNHNNLSKLNNNLSGSRSKIVINNASIPKKENIILNQRIVERFYAYSVLDYYSKYFKVNIDQDKDYDEENNIYANIKNKVINDKEDNTTNNKKNAKTKSKIGLSKKGGKGGVKGKGKATTEGNNNNNTDPKNKKKMSKSSIFSVNILSNYTERYTELKEKVKPIVKTNYIQLFDPQTTKITKIKVALNKEEHGYTTFPDGCRHLLIDSDLYITGGTDNCGYPINIVLLYNLAIGELSRLSNLNDNHSYHSVEYLENFDSIIVVGGENSSSCEIMDLDSKKWTKLPSLNSPRANANIYYNAITSDLFVLFGMEGEMTEKTKNTDAIEVLELNDIIGGWMMVDYYKSVGLDLKSNYCLTLPFTRDKLLVYGGASARSIEKRLFALFDMIKNECIKVDSDTMDLIKREEKQIRAFDNAIEKIT